MKLRSKGQEKAKDEEPQASEPMVWKFVKNPEGYTFDNRSTQQPLSQISSIRPRPVEKYAYLNLSYYQAGAHTNDQNHVSRDGISRPLAQTDDRVNDQRGPYPFTQMAHTQPSRIQIIAEDKQFHGNSTSFESKINQFSSLNTPSITPTCSSWFDINGIHQIERDAMVEFFSGKPSKTPQIYKSYRNHIIKLYKEDSKTYLTATACRKMIVDCSLSVGW
jgi:hypothetical protein